MQQWLALQQVQQVLLLHLLLLHDLIPQACDCHPMAWYGVSPSAQCLAWCPDLLLLTVYQTLWRYICCPGLHYG